MSLVQKRTSSTQTLIDPFFLRAKASLMGPTTSKKSFFFFFSFLALYAEADYNMA